METFCPIDQVVNCQGEKLTDLLISDVYNNAIRFRVCSDTLWMLHSIGKAHHGDYLESIILVHGASLVEAVKRETRLQSSLMIPGNKKNFLYSGFGTRLAWRLNKIVQKLANHGQFGLVALLPSDVVSNLIFNINI